MSDPTQSPYKSVAGFQRIGSAAIYSGRGFVAAFRHEAAFRQELGVALILIPLAFLIGQGALQVIVLIGVWVWVLVVEILNSALEALADAVSVETHPLLGRAKDLGSAAVMLSIVFACVVWLIFAVHYLRR